MIEHDLPIFLHERHRCPPHRNPITHITNTKQDLFRVKKILHLWPTNAQLLIICNRHVFEQPVIGRAHCKGAKRTLAGSVAALTQHTCASLPGVATTLWPARIFETATSPSDVGINTSAPSVGMTPIGTT